MTTPNHTIQPKWTNALKGGCDLFGIAGALPNLNSVENAWGILGRWVAARHPPTRSIQAIAQVIWDVTDSSVGLPITRTVR
ncbi:hypothetical protein AVEN_39922-1 [Araneus ventricosus]|uniref:Tc1-like transposase DDE domain-containing protein n=1 Tax=Araneus ventricosus TaxID=182803 RepID=A0A4Y2AJG6_ARAVE|nr:hypothetical protein AVEN_39922-1 [Araneus ventricosus]